MRIAAVLLPLPVPEAFDYAVPEGLALAPGDHVAVPLGPRLVRGLVSEVRDQTGSNRQLKSVAERLDDPAIPASTLAFAEWAARWTATPPGEMAALALRGLRTPVARPERRLVRVPGGEAVRTTPARRAVLAALEGGGTFATAAELARAAGVSSGVIRSLADEGVIRIEETVVEAAFAAPDPDHRPAELNPGQAAAAAVLDEAVAARAFRPLLLDGITGSGKTEVYLESVARLLRDDPAAQVLILLPEIALTQAVLARLRARFGVEVGEWHSGMAPPRRRRVWEAVLAGRCSIVVGARSALFLPFAALRLIVVDEEHDASFKQDEGLIYQARDLAVARASQEGCAVVLASATPSLETLWNAQSGRYGWIRLAARHGGAVLPDIGLIDLRQDPPERGRWLSPPLVAAMVETLGRGEQTLLFLNRRGYAPVVLCKACGHRMTAPDTESWLVEHRYTGRLVCHLTGFSMPRPKRCLVCAAENSLVSVGPGVERIEEEVRERFPDARVAVFSSDTIPDARSARSLVGAMQAGEIDVLIATQAAAKGHNFPNLTLVGVVDADLGLRGGDLRAGERTFQLMAQATGRAGRADKPGRALLQTWVPEHPVLQALKAADREGFVSTEMAERELARMPPFGRLAALVLSSPDGLVLDRVAQALAREAPNAEGLEVYGPADAPLSLIRGRRRKRLLVRADRGVDLQAYLREWLSRVKIPGSVRLNVDVDPYSFL